MITEKYLNRYFKAEKVVEYSDSIVNSFKCGDMSGTEALHLINVVQSMHQKYISKELKMEEDKNA